MTQPTNSSTNAARSAGGTKPALWWHPWAYYGSEAGLIVVILCLVLRLWRKDLTVPFALNGDALHHLAIARALADGGWWWHIERLSAPFTLPMVSFPVGGNVDYLLVKFLTLFTDEAGLAINLFWLISFVLCSITASWSMRQLSVRPGLSMVCGILYALLPSTFFRHIGHLMLVTYLLPPVLTLAVMLAVPRLLPERRWLRIGLLFSVFLLGLNYVYFAFFGGFCLLVGAALGFFKTAQKRVVYWCAAALTVLCVATVLNLGPTMSYWAVDKESQTLVRGAKSPSEADIYGLDLRDMLLPVQDHLIPLFARIERAFKQAAMPFGSGESSITRLGMTGSVGLLLLLLVSLSVRPVRSRDVFEKLRALSGLTLAAVLLATIGGFGSLFNIFVTPDIRVYARINVVIAFFSITAIALLLSHLAKKPGLRLTRPLIAIPVLGSLLIFGVLDQYCAQFLVGQYETFATKAATMKTLVGKLESVLPKGAAIYQLPYTPYPNTPFAANMPSHEHLVAYVFSKNLRWSWPSLSGRANQWNRRVSALPAPQLAATLALAGFEAIWVNRTGYEDQGVALIRDLTNLTDRVAESDDGQIVVLGLRRAKSEVTLGLSKDEIASVMHEVFEGSSEYPWGAPIAFGRPATMPVSLVSGWASDPGDGSQWSTGQEATIKFQVQPSSTDKILNIRILRYLPYVHFPVTLIIDGEKIGTQDMAAAGSYTFPIAGRLLAGKKSFLVTIETPNATSPKALGVNNDERVLGLAVSEMSIRDTTSSAAHSIQDIAAGLKNASNVYQWGNPIIFNGANAADLTPHLKSGWSPPGPKDTFTWTQGLSASLRLDVEPTSKDKVLSIKIYRFLPYKVFPVTVLIDDQVIGTQDMAHEGEYKIHVPAAVIAGKRSLVLTFLTPKATTPRRLGVNSDDRVLGLAMHEIALLETPKSANGQPTSTPGSK